MQHITRENLERTYRKALRAPPIGRSRPRTAPKSIGAEERPPKVLFVTSEFSDFVKAGGLGEVSAALPRALRQTHDIRVLLPGYPQVTAGRTISTVARLPAVAALPACEIGQIDMPDGLVVYVLICPELYDRDGSPYGDVNGNDWADNDIRFARLGLAAAEIANGRARLGWRPDLLHVNDWPAALAPGYLAWQSQPVPSILTIHNLAYQGLFDRERLPALAIPDNAFQIEGVEFYGRLSFLKAGISYASNVTTVSATYAEEVTRPEFGCGLDGLLRIRAEQGRLAGILNGIDESWEPSTDPHLAGNFDSHDLRGKARNAVEVREGFGLAVARGPLFAIVSRLVHQKGLDLVIDAADDVVNRGGQIAVIGQGESQVESALENLARRHPGSVGVRVGYNERDARCLYAGSDFLLMPSRFEPCGLSQMYAQRYGSLPVAYRTGGLVDTVEDGVTGFLFSELSLNGLLGGIHRAFESFGSRRLLNSMRRAAMGRSFGWRHSARRYGDLYSRLITKSPATQPSL